jgi:Fur family transcriptional regulator, zinc uptake regulator
MKNTPKKQKSLRAKQNRDSPALGANELSVKKILAKADKPLSAYDIIPLMTKELKHTVAPVTVYRALEHLAKEGLVTRIESRNAYTLCQHPHKSHDCLFFICRNCGTATEAPDSKISSLLRQEAGALGFGINKQILEVVGLCKSCASRSSSAAKITKA